MAVGQKTVTAVTPISKIQQRPFAKSSALVVIYGADLGRKFDLDEGRTSIGRSPKSDIQIDHDSVSRAHVKLTVENGRTSIEDVGSTNGTFLNDEALTGRVTLRNNDLVKVGRTVFKFIAHDNIEAAYHDEIYRLTTVDGLTQVHNRRYFDEAIERELSRCRRYGRALSLLLIDVDHFKSINDTFGHPAGDEVLQGFARIIQSCIRNTDIACRFGGEEVAVIMPHTSPADAQVVAERIRSTLQANVWPRHPEHFVTVSIGLAGASGLIEGLTKERWLEAADQALYNAKRNGRNRVVLGSLQPGSNPTPATSTPASGSSPTARAG